jgi:hypothetical protein
MEADQEAIDRRIVAVLKCVSRIDAEVRFGEMGEVVVAAEVDPTEDLGCLTVTEEGEGPGIGFAVADAANDGVEVKADLSVSSNGRKGQSQGWNKKPQFHRVTILKKIKLKT